MRKADSDYYYPNAGSSGLLATRVLSDLASQSGEVLVRGDASYSPVAASAWLPAALDELSGIDAEAQESGYEPPSQRARNHADRILQSIGYLGLPTPAPSVYPTSDREVAIFFRSASRRASVLILCAADGQGACFAFADGKGRRARYEDAGELPDAFVRAQLLHVR